MALSATWALRRFCKLTTLSRDLTAALHSLQTSQNVMALVLTQLPCTPLLQESRSYASSRRDKRSGKWGSGTDNSALLETKAATMHKESILVRDERNALLGDMPFSDALKLASEKKDRQLVFVERDVATRARIFKIIPKPVREAVVPLSINIGDADLKVKLRIMMKGLLKGKNVVVLLKSKQTDSAADRMSFINKLSELYKSEHSHDIIVKEIQNGNLSIRLKAPVPSS